MNLTSIINTIRTAVYGKDMVRNVLANTNGFATEITPVIVSI